MGQRMHKEGSKEHTQYSRGNELWTVWQFLVLPGKSWSFLPVLMLEDSCSRWRDGRTSFWVVDHWMLTENRWHKRALLTARERPPNRIEKRMTHLKFSITGYKLVNVNHESRFNLHPFSKPLVSVRYLNRASEMLQTKLKMNSKPMKTSKDWRYQLSISPLAHPTKK